jgi:hypothetical protein
VVRHLFDTRTVEMAQDTEQGFLFVSHRVYHRSCHGL